MSSIKKILFMSAIAFCLGGGDVFATDNVLQAVQINGVSDSYNIILKSDDIAEVKKTVQAPNKIVLLLKGIRASKTINTIYNNTANIDSVVVEPSGDEQVKILIQGANVGEAKVQFDSLKTPLGVLGNSSSQTKSNGEITLSDPVTSFRPVYNQNDMEEDDGTSFSLADSGLTLAKYAKKALSGASASLVVTFGLFVMLLLSVVKLVKGKDNEIKIGLSQGMQEREINMYKGLGAANMSMANMGNIQQPVQNQPMNSPHGIQNNVGVNYGLKNYQNGTRSPYATPEIQRASQVAPMPAQPIQQAPSPAIRQMAKAVSGNVGASQPIQNMMQNTIQKTAAAPKTTNIDSMKFLESMTKIYEKNGRTDLAQGLKSNMQKARMGMGA